MRILAIESSGKTAGTAFYEDGTLISESYINSKLTHSKTLLPMVESMLKCLGLSVKDMDAVAVSAGPGSFTGLRIGAATAKGLSLAYDLPVVPVSSLMALARNMIFADALICPVMDARRGEVYGACYEVSMESGELFPRISDVAMEIGEFLSKVKALIGETGKKAVFLGDGVPVHKELIEERLAQSALFAPDELLLQRAGSVAILGAALFAKGETVSSDDFVPRYCRIPLAQKEKEEGILEDPGSRSLKKISRGDFHRTRHPEND